MKSCMGEGNNWTALCLVAPHASQPGFPGNFYFGPFIRRILVEPGTVFAQT